MIPSLKGYHKETLEECAIHQIPITRYKSESLGELIKNIEKHWHLVSSIELEDMSGIELFRGDIVEDDEGRLFELGYCFDYKEPSDRKHFARNEMRCIKSSDKHKEDHIKIGRKYAFGDWFYPTNMLNHVGNIYQNSELIEGIS